MSIEAVVFSLPKVRKDLNERYLLYAKTHLLRAYGPWVSVSRNVL